MTEALTTDGSGGGDTGLGDWLREVVGRKSPDEGPQV